MADTLCGPSNPLQNFQKHTSADRTLQQDRFTSRAGPSQGFRSEPGPSAGLLDPEFEAFQAGHSPNFLEPQLPHHPRQNLQPPPIPVSQHPANAAGWASDFQRLHISQPHTPQSHLPSQPSAPAWHLDFQRQQAPPSTQHQQQPLLHQTPQFQYNQPSYSFSPMNQYPLGQQYQSNTSNFVSSSSQDQNQYDAEAFEQAFAAHASALLQEDTQQQAEQRSAEIGQDVLLDGPDVLQSMDDNVMYSTFSAKETGSQREELERLQERAEDLVRDSVVLDREAETQRDIQDRSAADEDLARTAGELLERVADDTSTKFRESNFLSLMAQLRDREVRVDGNDFVATDDQAERNTESSFASTATRQRPSSVPPRNRVGLNGGGGGNDFRMTGALPAGELAVENPGPKPRRSENFQEWLNANGLPNTHMVDDF